MTTTSRTITWTTPLSRTLLAGAIAGVTALAGCTATTTSLATTGTSAPAAASAGGAGVGGTPAVDPAQCQQLASWPAPSGTGLMVLVVDLTASAAAADPSPALLQALADAQAQRLALQLVSVDGPGATPRIAPPMVLDPYPGNSSEDANEARQIALGCAAEATLDRGRLAPTSAGSDQLRAIITALGQHPRMLAVVSDGVPVGGLVGIDVIGWDAPVEQVAAAAASRYRLPGTDAGLSVIWVGLAHTRTVLPEWAPNRLKALWTGLLPGVRITFDPSRGATRAVTDLSGLPADTIPVPTDTPLTWTTPTGTATAGPDIVACLRLPSTLLFQPGTAELVAPDALAPVVDTVIAQVTGHPDWAIQVGGHTADYGTPPSRQALSEQRANVLATALRQGLSRSGLSNPVTGHGYGSTVPAQPEYRQDGSHDLAAATANRRVTVAITRGSGTPFPTC